jgi:hypothetical protein
LEIETKNARLKEKTEIQRLEREKDRYTVREIESTKERDSVVWK